MTDGSQLIAGNWKMNLGPGEAKSLAASLAAAAPGGGARLAVFPPFVWLQTIAEALKGSDVALGAQDCHAAEAGAHTGDVSAAMVERAGCVMVIVGHSERRGDHAESDRIVRLKAEAALSAGLAPIVCVGETLEQREAGAALAAVGAQIEGSLPQRASSDGLMIAYEPVWAIGAGKAATLETIAEMHAHIGSVAARVLDAAAPPVLYGGSVKPENAHSVLTCPGVGGALVGGASLTADSFLAIAAAARQSVIRSH